MATDEAFSDPLSTHPDAGPGAVLLSDQIEYYIKNFDPPLLTLPDKTKIPDSDLAQCLDAASYRVRIGGEANVAGVRTAFDDEHPLVLKPHQVAVVKTYEVVNIPRFLVARWNLRVTWVYEGLLWVGGPQVDPGWQGHLYCPLYNLAERDVVIPFKDRVFTMDFTRTTPVHREEASYGYKSMLHAPARPKTLQGHDINRLRSAPFEELRKLERLEEQAERLQAEASQFRNFALTILGLLFTVMVIMVAVLSIEVVRPVVPENGRLLSGWPLTALAGSLLAFIISLASLVAWVLTGRNRGKGDEKKVAPKC